MDGSIHSDGARSFPPDLIQVPDVVPIFPLPETVLLPGEILPLHIFEPRYRDMVRDALAGHRVIGIVQALPGDHREDPGTSQVQPVGCLGFIAQHQELADGRFLLWLLGLERFRIDQEMEAGTRYRQVRVRYVPAETPAERNAGIQPVRQELRGLLPRLVNADDATRALLSGQMREVSDTQLIALACQILELGADRKQEILEASSQVDRFLMVYEDVYRHLELNPSLGQIEEGEAN